MKRLCYLLSTFLIFAPSPLFSQKPQKLLNGTQTSISAGEVSDLAFYITTIYSNPALVPNCQKPLFDNLPFLWYTLIPFRVGYVKYISPLSQLLVCDFSEFNTAQFENISIDDFATNWLTGSWGYTSWLNL